MYTFQDIKTGELVEFSSVNKLTLERDKDYISGELSAYVVQINKDRYYVSEEFYNKVKKEKGL